jgi:elongation factor 1-beta
LDLKDFLEVKKMGEVVSTIRIMPESPDVDLAKIKEDVEKSIPSGTELHKIEEEPIAFGLVALNVVVVVDDAEGGTEKAEENLSKLENISSIEVVDVRRLM